MYCMSGISQTFQHIRSTLAGSLFQNTLIRIFSWSEIMHAHSGDRFELCVGSSCANRRNLIVSWGIILHQLTETRNRIFWNIQVIYQRRIKEWFQLKKQNIRTFFFLSFGEIFLRLFYSRNLLLGIIPGTTDTCIENSSCQTIRISVIFIGKGNISEIIGKYSLFQCKLCTSGEKQSCQNDQRNIVSVFQFPCIFRSFDQQDQKQQDHDSKQDADCHNTCKRQVFVGNLQRIGDQMQIRSGKRRNTVQQENAIDNGQYQPEQRNQNPPERSSPEQINNQWRSENKSCIICENQRFLGHIIPGFYKWVTADCLHNKISYSTGKYME